MWLKCWDELREYIRTSKTSYGRTELLALMTNIEREKVRETLREAIDK